jgi:hypothetical protein
MATSQAIRNSLTVASIGGGGDGEPVVVQAEHEDRVAQPEGAEDPEDGGHRALADGRGPDRGQEQAQGRGRQDDGQRGTENSGRHDADQRQAEGDRTDDEAAQAQHGRVARHRSDHGAAAAASSARALDRPDSPAVASTVVILSLLR